MAYKENHKEKMSAYLKKYRRENKQKAQDYNLNYKNKNKEKLKADRICYRKKQAEKIRHQVWKNKLKARYGLTPQQYFDLMKKHGGKCAICGSDKKLGIDHCHKTKKIRGILCGDCNRGLGLFKDNQEFLLKAVNYLK
jgi:hypothetical protein